MAHTLNATHTGFNLSGRIRAFVEKVRQDRARDAEYSRIYNELQRLSDSALSDIGLRRSDIPSIAYEHAAGH